MIQPNELRIGNWVFNTLQKGFGVSTGYIQVDILENGKLNGSSAGLQFIEPIPLTPEILEKCGVIENVYRWFEQELQYRWNDNSVAVFGSDGCTEGHAIHIENIRYLHQFQNLCYYLTGEELKVDL